MMQVPCGALGRVELATGSADFYTDVSAAHLFSSVAKSFTFQGKPIGQIPVEERTIGIDGSRDGSRRRVSVDV